jgi:RimJ/RimL family protein N-acetyltransferase
MINPLLRDIPEQIETDRLRMRCPLPTDGKALYEAVYDSQAELERWMPWSHGYTPELAEVFVREARIRFLKRDDLPLLIFRKEDGILLGSTGLHDIVWDVPRFEIGYWLSTRFTGSGFMTEAVIGLTKFCREQFGAHRVTIRCDAQNTKSRQVAERSGFALESIAAKDRRGILDGQLSDTLTFARIWPD